VLGDAVAEAPELRPGPYTAETFEVHVEDDFVVLQI
jgi:hypothetical protein